MMVDGIQLPPHPRKGSRKILLSFEWSPPWHLFVSVSDISSAKKILDYIRFNLLTFYSGILSGITSYLASFVLLYWHFLWHSIWHFFCHMFWHTFWHSIWHLFGSSFLAFPIWYIFGDSLWLRSGGEHRGTLWSGARGRGPAETLWSCACCSGPAGTTAI